MFSSAPLLALFLAGASCDPAECVEDSSSLLLTAPAGPITIHGNTVPLRVDAYGGGVVFLRAEKGLLVDTEGASATRCLKLGEVTHAADRADPERIFASPSESCPERHVAELRVMSPDDAPTDRSHRTVVYAALHRGDTCDAMTVTGGDRAVTSAAQASLELVFEPDGTAPEEEEVDGGPAPSDGGDSSPDVDGGVADLDGGTDAGGGA